MSTWTITSRSMEGANSSAPAPEFVRVDPTPSTRRPDSPYARAGFHEASKAGQRRRRRYTDRSRGQGHRPASGRESEATCGCLDRARATRQCGGPRAEDSGARARRGPAAGAVGRGLRKRLSRELRYSGVVWQVISESRSRRVPRRGGALDLVRCRGVARRELCPRFFRSRGHGQRPVRLPVS